VAPELEVPDPLEFVLSADFLRRRIYPRQGTLLKLIFLRDDLLTEYDYEVIRAWGRSFANPNGQVIGIQPDILERLEICKAEGRPWFREVIFVGGRRGSKSFLGALAGAYVLWHYLTLGDPQGHFGIDRSKQLGVYVFANQEQQAMANQWKDLRDVIIGAKCFIPWVPRSPKVELLQVFAPNDDARVRELMDLGITLKPEEMSSFVVAPMGSAAVSARGPAACMDPNSLVLKADLTWVPIKDLQPGDDLVGIEEGLPVKSGQRRLVKSQVLAKWRTVQESLRLTFDDGTSVVCSKDHRWLAANGHDQWLWQEANWCTPGVRIRALVDPWSSLSSYEAGYLAGAFDGEGCVITNMLAQGNKGSIVQFSQNPGTMLDTVLKMLADLGYQVTDASCHLKCRRYQIRGLNQTLRFLGEVRPKRLLERAELLWVGRTVRANKTTDGYKTVVKVEDLGRRSLIDIKTTSRTFVAEGLFTHNCMDFFDEFALVTRATSKSSSEDLWQAATPALDQFRKWAFIYMGSSPYQMTGQFYAEYEEALARSDGSDGLDEGTILRPEVMMTQLTSWDIYEDWQVADEIPIYPDRPETYPHQVSAPQEYDEQMRRLERANPATFMVERRAQWAAVQDAYFSTEVVDSIFEPWPPPPALPVNLSMLSHGPMVYTYTAHADPSDSDANFGFALAHTVNVPNGLMPHVVFDLITHWSPQEFPDGHIDYAVVLDDIKNICRGFAPDQISFDQGYSAWMISELKKWATWERPVRPCQFFKRSATAPLNWTVAEVTKTACGLGYVHAPTYDLLSQEMKFLQKSMSAGALYGRVDHPTSGPVTTKDVWDAVSNVVYSLIGDRVAALVGESLMAAGIRGAQPGGLPLSPYPKNINPEVPQNPVHDALAQLSFRRTGNTNMPSYHATNRSGRIIGPRSHLVARPGRWR
jgi:hypothetical protein